MKRAAPDTARSKIAKIMEGNPRPQTTIVAVGLKLARDGKLGPKGRGKGEASEE